MNTSELVTTMNVTVLDCFLDHLPTEIGSYYCSSAEKTDSNEYIAYYLNDVKPGFCLSVILNPNLSGFKVLLSNEGDTILIASAESISELSGLKNVFG